MSSNPKSRSPESGNEVLARSLIMTPDSFYRNPSLDRPECPPNLSRSIASLFVRIAYCVVHICAVPAMVF